MRISATQTLVLLVLPTALSQGRAFGGVAAPESASGVSFRDFNGVVYLPGSEIAKQLGVGWSREIFAWSTLQPDPGKWNWERTDQRLRDAQAEGVEILPDLGSTAPWATSIAGNDRSPPKRVEDWQNFVEQVVARYSAAPFNLRYFQVWNEPTREAGFWAGRTNRDFIDTIYLPAARIIRRHGCNVVLGGWPVSNSLQELNDLLTYHNAWQWTDIIDVHYRIDSAWQPLYDQWVKTGKCRGIWQSEIGFRPEPDYLPNVYLRALNWALQSGWTDPNQYKVFWYATWGAGPDAEKCLTKTDASKKIVLTENGKHLSVINDVLGKGFLSSFTQFSTNPPLPPTLSQAAPTALGFRVGEGGVVITLLLDNAIRQNYPFLPIQVSLRRKPQRVELVDASGARRALPADYSAGRLQVKVPTQALAGVCPKCNFAVGFLLIE